MWRFAWRDRPQFSGVLWRQSNTQKQKKHSLFEYNLLLITAAYAGMALFLLLVDMNSASNMGKIGEGTSH